MNRMLQKLKLIECFKIELDIQKDDFVYNFRQNVDVGGVGFFNSDPFESFSSNNNEYIGYVGFENFKIKRRRRFADRNFNLSIAKGTYSQEGNKLKIDTEINGFSRAAIPFYIFSFVFISLIFVSQFLLDDDINFGDEHTPYIINFTIVFLPKITKDVEAVKPELLMPTGRFNRGF